MSSPTALSSPQSTALSTRTRRTYVPLLGTMNEKLFHGVPPDPPTSLTLELNRTALLSSCVMTILTSPASSNGR